MILSAALRTDIPAYYSEWFFRRLKDGSVYSRNPLFPNKVTEYSLARDKVDAFYFCSKNYAPMLPRLGELEGYRTLFHATVNAYGADLEPNALPEKETCATVLALSKSVGRERVFWRYDPIVLTKKYSPAFHLASFERLAAVLSPHVAGCVVNFLEPTRAIVSRIPGLLLPTLQEKYALMAGLGALGEKYQLRIRVCGQGAAPPGIERNGCLTLKDIAEGNSCDFKAVKHTGNRRGCLCIPCRDLGWYDTCPAGCTYCNANRMRSELSANVAAHDPASPLLIGTLREDDLLLKSPQESYLADRGGQISLFDL